MRFVRILGFDIRNGILRHWFYYAATVVFACISVLDLWAMRKAYQGMVAMEADSFSLGDYVAGTFAGMKEYVFDPLNPFDFPALWMFSFLLVSYITLYYPYRDLMGVGKHIVVASQSRSDWWYAKCAWVLLSISSFFLVYGLVFCLVLCLTGGAFSLDVAPSTTKILGFGYSLVEPFGSIAPLLVLFPLMTLAICLLQLLLSLVIKPLPSYLCTITLYFLSSYFMNPLFMGNYLMAARSEAFVMDGMGFVPGTLLALAVIAVAVFAGSAWTTRMDIIERS